MSAHTLQQQIDAVAREIKMREYVYPGRVAAKKMKQEKADYEIAVMKSVLATLMGLQACDRWHTPEFQRRKEGQHENDNCSNSARVPGGVCADGRSQSGRRNHHHHQPVL